MQLRQLQPEDKAGLAAGFERMSKLSRYRRLLGAMDHLSTKQLAYLTEVDHSDHEALVAFEPAHLDGVGVARYLRSTTVPTEAELAVAMADDWQQLGLGTALLRHLARPGGEHHRFHRASRQPAGAPPARVRG